MTRLILTQIVYIALGFRGKKDRIRAHIRGRLAGWVNLPSPEDMEILLRAARTYERAERLWDARARVEGILKRWEA